MTPSSQTDLTVVTTPTIDWLVEKSRNCRDRLLIASPFVNSGVIDVTSLAPAGVTRSVITRMVTSANATNGGMRRNLECGLATSNSGVVAQLSKTLLRGFDAEVPRVMTIAALEALRLALSSIRVFMPQPTPVPMADTNPVFSVTDDAVLLAGFRGWTNLVLRGVMALPAGEFVLEDVVNICRPLASLEYPKNRNVPAKIRQQLQVLRDDGIVDFVNYQGVYRRTMLDRTAVSSDG